MVAETNRKRRKLERDRRAAERPQPCKFIQLSPQIRHLQYANVHKVPRVPHYPLEIPVPPTLYDTINKNSHSASTSRRRGKDLPPQPLRAYPTLSSLSSTEITHDLDYLFNHRWPPEPPPARYDSFAQPTPPGMGVVLDMSPYGGRPPASAPPPRRRYPPGPSGLQHELEHGTGPFSRPLTPHGAKVNGWMPSSGPSRHGDSTFERDEREREEIELREREREYLIHKQQQHQQQLQQEQLQQQQQQQQQMHYVIQQPQQQHAPPARPLPHSRTESHVGPGQGPQLPPQTHHSSSGHHHHHVHYHHVHHHHHSSSSAPPPSLPPQPPISPLHSYDGPRRAPSRDMEPPRVSAPELINLTSGPGTPLPPRQWEREREHEPPSPRHRDGERDMDRDRDRDREREREQRDRDRGRPASGPPPAGPHERIMTPFSASLPPAAAPRPSRGSFSESVQQQPPPPPPPPRTPQQGGGTPQGSPVRARALPGRMVSPAPPLSVPPPTAVPPQLAQPPPPPSQLSPPRTHRMPPPPASPSAKPMDGERERDRSRERERDRDRDRGDRILLPLPLPPLPPAPQPLPRSMTPGPTMPPPPSAQHPHVAAHRMPLPPPPPLLSPPQGQGPGASQPPPSVPVVAGEGA